MEKRKEYEIDNGIIRLTALNYGACITGIYVADRKGKRENVVACFADIKDFVNQGGPYLNAAVGPYAGRIAYGAYQDKDGKHQLSINNGKHHLHGGNSGISMQYFHVRQEKDTLLFHLESEHAQDGYPRGTYVYDITYRLDHDKLIITLHAIPPKRSLLSMTNHLYFNLAGEGRESICSHELRLDSTKRGRIHEDGHPCEIIDILPGDAYDFHTQIKIADRYEKDNEELSITNGYDTPFLLHEGGVSLYHAQSGRSMDITSDASSIVMYSANGFDEGLCLNQGRKGYPYSFLALELQSFPNAVNVMADSDPCFFDPKHPFHQMTTYRFTYK